MMRYGLIAIAALTLAGCSSKNSDKGTVGPVIKAQLATVVAARKAAKSGVKPAAPKPFTMADAAKSKVKLIRVQVPVYKSASLAQLAASNRGFRTFMTSGQQSLTFKGSELTATRGLRNDLMARSTSGNDRVYKYLDDLNHTRQLTMTCESTRVGSEVVQILDLKMTLIKIEEICKGQSRAIKNVKWVSASGMTRKAYQWAGDELGFIIIEWLN